MPATIKIDSNEVRIALNELGAGLTDKTPLLKNFGEIMATSIKSTFRDEGSPAGSWPALAASTRKKKGYTAGHKLLIMSGRLFGSFNYEAAGNTLTVGTNVVYAAVHQFGSRDYQGNLAASVKSLTQAITAYGGGKRAIGPERESKPQGKGKGKRRQNIPPRPFLVFRPEDPGRLVEAAEAYLHGKVIRIGRIGAQ